MLEIVKAYKEEEPTVGFSSTFRFDGVEVVIIADAGSVHVYLVRDGQISASSWLFNRLPYREQDLNIPLRQPMNLDHFSRGFDLDGMVHQSKFMAHRFRVDDSFVYGLYYDAQLIGRIWDGPGPGDSVFAVQASPLAFPTRDDCRENYRLPQRV